MTAEICKIVGTLDAEALRIVYLFVSGLACKEG